MKMIAMREKRFTLSALVILRESIWQGHIDSMIRVVIHNISFII